MASAAGFTACDGDLERPPMIEPEATIKPNTTIADVKASVWQTDRNYVTEIGQRGGEDIIIAGRVVSNDLAGNVFKNIVLQDETGALAVSINSYDLYKTYQQGQEIVVNLTGLKIGGFNGLLQVGAEGVYNGAPSMTFMDKTLFAEHAEQNGLARIALIDTVLTTIPEVMTAKASVEGLQKWQSQFIRIDGVSFEDAGKPFAEGKSTSRYVKDAQGNRINVYNSSYADFADAILPSGTGSIAGILSFYGTDWQVILNNLDGCIGFDPIDDPDQPENPDQPDLPGGDGTKENPYTVEQVLGGASGTGWVKGYIVGSVTDKSYDSAVLGASPASQTNIIIAASPDETDAANCVPVQLPAGDVRTKLNLADNPGNYKAEVTLEGSLEAYFGKAGIKTVTAFTITGGTEVTPPDPADNLTFKAVTTITSGKTYAIVADGKAAKVNTGNYGYLSVVDVTDTNGTISAPADCAYTITAVDGGYTIAQSDGRYLYQTGTFNSFNFDASAVEGSTWTITPDSDGKMVITNVSVNKSIQFDTQYTSYGSYPDVRGVYPTLYEKVD